MTKRKAIIICSATVAVIAAIIAVIFTLDKDEIKTMSIEDINKELREMQFGEYQNLNFVCEPPREPLGELNTVSYISPTDGCSEDDVQKLKEQLVSKMDALFGIKIDPEKIERYGNEGVMYNPETEAEAGKFAQVWRAGSFAFVSPRAIETKRQSKNAADPTSYIDLSEPEDADKTVTIYGKEVNIKKAAEYAEQVIRDKLVDFLNEGEDIEFAYAYAITDDNNYPNYLKLVFAHTIDGIRVNEYGTIDADPYAKGETFFCRPALFEVMMTGENEIAEIYNSYYYDIIGKSADEIDEIIGLSDAAKLLSRELAPNLKNDVVDVRLKYVTITSNETYLETLTMKPMWSFVFDKFDGHESYDELDTVTAYVDAVDGTVYYCDTVQLLLDISEKDESFPLLYVVLTASGAVPVIGLIIFFAVCKNRKDDVT